MASRLSSIPPAMNTFEIEPNTCTIPKLRVPSLQLVTTARAARHYAVSFKGRCFGLCESYERAHALVEVFGQGCLLEELAGPVPKDEQAAALAYELSLLELDEEPDNDQGRDELVEPFSEDEAPARPGLRLIRGGRSQ